jgi:putative addiction module component (TIGR02574 family)
MLTFTMTEQTRRLLDEILSLPPDERAALVAELTASVPDGALSDEWLAEIERRIGDVQSGRVRCTPWEEVKARLQTRFAR